MKPPTKWATRNQQWSLWRLRICFMIVHDDGLWALMIHHDFSVVGHRLKWPCNHCCLGRSTSQQSQLQVYQVLDRSSISQTQKNMVFGCFDDSTWCKQAVKRQGFDVDCDGDGGGARYGDSFFWVDQLVELSSVSPNASFLPLPKSISWTAL